MRLLAAYVIDCADPDAVQRLYCTTGRAALSKTEHLVGRWDVAQEIVQEVFLRLWQQKLRFGSEKQAYVWVYKACHNAGIDHLRSAATRHEQGEREGWLGSLEAVVALADLSLKRQWVMRLLQDLDEREAAILGYTVIDGMKEAEIATLTGLSRRSVGRTCAKLSETLARLKETAGAVPKASPVTAKAGGPATQRSDAAWVGAPVGSRSEPAWHGSTGTSRGDAPWGHAPKPTPVLARPIDEEATSAAADAAVITEPTPVVAAALSHRKIAHGGDSR